MIKQQIAYLRRNLTSIETLASCGGCLLAAGSPIYQKLLVVSEIVRQQAIFYHSESKSVADRIVSLSQAYVRAIVVEKQDPTLNLEQKSPYLSLVTVLLFWIDEFVPYNEGENQRVQALAYRRRHRCYPGVI